jgi:dimethylaniline monooxygenase (N-oxide forming)
MQPPRKIAIIGAGCSGLAAIKCCLDDGLEPTCFEREDDLGGLWNYSDTPKVGKGSIYNTCTINTSKEMMAYSDYPPPADFPMFMPHRYVLEYIRMYASNFDLLKHVLFSECVKVEFFFLIF